MKEIINIALIMTVIQTVCGTPIELGYKSNLQSFHELKPKVYPQPFITTTTPWPTTFNKTEVPITIDITPERQQTPSISTEKNKEIIELNNKFKQQSMEIGTLDEFLASTTHKTDLVTNKSTIDNDKIIFPDISNRFGEKPNKTTKTTNNPNTIDLNYRFGEEPIISKDITKNKVTLDGVFEESYFGHPSFSFNPKIQSKVPSLSYKPIRPFYAQNWNGYPLPTTKSTNVKDKTTSYASSTVPNLNYVPSKPFYAPSKPYPIENNNNLPHTTTGTIKNEENNMESTTLNSSTVDKINLLPLYASKFPYLHSISNLTHLPHSNTKENEETLIEITLSTVPNLNYVPSKPFYAQHYPYLVQVSNLTKEKEENRKETNNFSTIPAHNLNYVPSTPFYAQNNIYPQPVTNLPQFSVIKETNNEISSSPNIPSSNVPIFDIKDKESTTLSAITVPNLNYVPSRPFYAPNYPYPENKSNLTKDKEENKKGSSSFNSITVPNLNYKPVRPFYAQNNYYPHPTNLPQFSVIKENNVTPFDETIQYDNLLLSLQQLIDFVKNQKTIFQTADSTDMTSKFDVNKIAEAIKPLFTTSRTLAV